MYVEQRRNTLCESTLNIEKAVRAIPYGKVSTYGWVALAAGLPHGARQVARILHTRGFIACLPWHRVVGIGKKNKALIKLSGSGFIEQLVLLRSEGVNVNDEGEIDLRSYGFY